MKDKKGFTLIELLAVIVILAVLMVIAVPKILNVIDSSRSSAADSSIKLIKDGIKTSVTSAEILPTNPFVKSEGCYLFDFDNNNTNVQNLKIDNKERAGGSIKLCNGRFSDDTLTFDGASSSSEPTNPNIVYIIKNGRFVSNEYNISGFVEDYQNSAFGNMSVTEGDGYIQVAVSGQRDTYNCKSVKFNNIPQNYETIYADISYERTTNDSSVKVLTSDASTSNSVSRSVISGKLMSHDTSTYYNNAFLYSCFHMSHTTTYKIYNLYIEKVAATPAPSTPSANAPEKIDIFSYLANDSSDFTYSNATVTSRSSSGVSFYNYYGSNGVITYNKTMDLTGYTKLHVKGHRGNDRVDNSYLHLYIRLTDNNNVTYGPAIQYPAANTDFDYTYDLPEGLTSVKNAFLNWAYGDYTITDWYLE